MIPQFSDTPDIHALVEYVARRLSKQPAEIGVLIDATFEEICEALKREETVSLRNFGTFYIDTRRTGTVFKFNPSQRLKALFGWSSTYKGELYEVHPVEVVIE